MPETSNSDFADNRGCITMTAREAEELNQEVAKAVLRSGGDVYVFVPLNLPGAIKPSFRHTKCPALVTNSQGGAPSRPHGTTSGASRRRESGEPRERKRPASAVVGGAVSSLEQESFAPSGAHRSKRPKVQAQPSRISVGGEGGVSGQMKPVLKALNEVLRNVLARPFAAPVDPNIYPDYYVKVRNPTDLGTVKKQLENGVYSDVEAVKADVARVWENCALYNGDEAQIVKDSDTLNAIWNEKLDAIADEAAARVSEDASKDASKSLKQQQRRLELEMKAKLDKQMEVMEAQMKATMEAQFAAKLQQMGMPMAGGQPTGGKGRAKAGGVSKRRSSDFQAGSASGMQGPAEPAHPAMDVSRDMTYEEKSQMSAGINKLRSENLLKVVDIIRTNMPSLGKEGEEIQVDLNTLDRRTLWELHKFVHACLNKNKAKPKKAPTQTTASRTLAAQQTLAGTEQRIAQLQRSLAAHGAGSSGTALSSARGADDFGHDDSLSGSDSEGELTSAAAPAGGAAGGAGYYAGFAQTKAQSDRERQDAERRRQEAERSAAAKRGQREEQERARIARERAAARAAQAAGGSGIDMLGQSNAMASFEDGTDTFDFSGLDEYGES